MDDLDRVLRSEEPLRPSSGFAARVMDAVEEAASAASPLPFPWARFGLAVLSTCLGVAAGLWLLSNLDLSPVAGALSAVKPELGYAAATIVGTFAVLCAPRMLIAARRLALGGDPSPPIPPPA